MIMDVSRERDAMRETDIFFTSILLRIILLLESFKSGYYKESSAWYLTKFKIKDFKGIWYIALIDDTTRLKFHSLASGQRSKLGFKYAVEDDLLFDVAGLD